MTDQSHVESTGCKNVSPAKQNGIFPVRKAEASRNIDAKGNI